jgi:DNA polymerase-3 subunit beta
MLTGVCLDIRGDAVTLAATDRYRLAVRDLHWAPAQPGMRAVALVPGRTLADAARVMVPGVPVSLSFVVPEYAGEAPGRGPRPVEGMISFDSGGRRLTGRLIAGEFIRYESRFPAGYGCRAEMPAASLIEAVRRVSLVADRASPVRLTFGSGTVALEAQTEGRARAVERVTASFHGDEPAIAFNPHYLLDGITAAAASAAPARHPAPSASPADGTGSAEGAVPDGTAHDGATGSATIRLEFTSPARPALITLAEDGAGGYDTVGGDTDDAADGAATDDGRADDRPAPPFRYLVVPLRSPVRR